MTLRLQNPERVHFDRSEKMDLYTADVSESMSCTKAPQKIQKNYIISL
jgi:hypothetical protein